MTFWYRTANLMNVDHEFNVLWLVSLVLALELVKQSSSLHYFIWVYAHAYMCVYMRGVVKGDDTHYEITNDNQMYVYTFVCVYGLNLWLQV